MLCEMAGEFRRLDKKRLVHYEGIFHDRRYPETSDMESQMYTSVADIRRYLVLTGLILRIGHIIL